MPSVEFPIKGAADYIRFPHDLRDRVDVRLFQMRVGMLKKKHIAGGLVRARIHLRTAIRRRELHQRRAPLLHDRLGFRAARRIHDDRFRDTAGMAASLGRRRARFSASRHVGMMTLMRSGGWPPGRNVLTPISSGAERAPDPACGAHSRSGY